MTRPTTMPSPAFGRGTRAAAFALAAAFTLSHPAQAQSFRIETLRPTMLHDIRIEASNPDVVRVLTGIGEIRADLQLGLLFLADGMARPEASHFAHPRQEIWPAIKDAVLAAGGTDIEPLLLTLETASSQADAMAALQAVEVALAKARSALNPTAGDAVLAILAMARDAAGQINPSGPTEVFAYQTAWSVLMTARGEMDLLARNEDPAIAKLAVDAILALDDLIISMPDPNQTAPVDLDAGPINDLVRRLEQLTDAA